MVLKQEITEENFDLNCDREKLEKIAEKLYTIGKSEVSKDALSAGATILDLKTFLSTLGLRIKQFPDRSAKWLLENTENLRGLLQIIAGDIVEHFDFDRVEIKNTTFIADDLRQQESDLVYLLPFRDPGKTSDANPNSATEVMIYILVEHQSKVDRTMGYRLLSYMGRIWESQRRESVSHKNCPRVSGDFSRLSRLCFTRAIRHGRLCLRWRC